MALYSCCKATSWAEGTPGVALPEGLGDPLGEGEGLGEGEELVDMEAPWDQEGEGLSDPLGEGEGLGDGEGDADGAGDDDTGPAQGEHQGWRWRVPPLKVQSVKQLGDKSTSPITESKEGTVPTKLLF